MTFQGRVVKKRVGRGSKSEHDAVLLSTDRGEFLLRRQGGNPFADRVLDGLVGKVIECEGTVLGTTLVLSTWRVSAPPGK